MMDMLKAATHTLRTIATAGMLTSLTIGLLATSSDAQAARIFELDRIVAIVNDDVIVMSELDARVRQIKADLRQSGTQAPQDDVLRRQVLERLIVDKLQVQLATQRGIVVNDQDLNRAVTSLAKQNELSLREFRNILERDGYDFGRFREQIKNEMLITRIQQQLVANRITVSQRDIDNYLATAARQGGAGEFLLGHILIALPEGASASQIAASQERARSIVARLKEGVDFAETAVAESDGQQALQGGNLGWRKQNELPTLFSDAITQLASGEVSEPLRSPSGFHIVKVMEKRGSGRHVVKQTRVRQILLKTSELASDQQVKERILSLKRRIDSGEDFAIIARGHSEDTANAIKGGELGWITPGSTVASFEQTMDSLPLNAVSDPVRTEFGWHLVQVLARREHDDTTEVRKAEAAEKIRLRKMDEEMRNWLRQVRDEAYVEYRTAE